MSVAAFALASAPTAAAPLSGFLYQPKANMFGYYLPKPDLRVGKFQLIDIAIGIPDEFKQFLSGKRIAGYAPVMLEFEDVTSKTRLNELGHPYHINAPRVLPVAFRVAGSAIAFDGDDKQLRHVTFIGKFDLAKVHAAGGGQESGAVLAGDLTVGSKIFKGLTFTWFGGD